MGIRNLLAFTLLLSTVSAQFLDDPWLRDPLLMSLWKLTRAINSFSFNLFEDITFSENGNIVICPYSLASALGILHFGSAGSTEKELAEVLGYKANNLTKEEVAQTFYLLSTKHLKSSNPKFYIFDSASTIVINRKNGLLPTFQRMVEVLFQAPITVSDFMSSADELVRSLNDWVAARTRNKIKQIIDSIDPFSDMIILNAAYFKGVWVHKFLPQNTKPGDFYNHGLSSGRKSVDMMHMSGIFNFHIDDRHSIAELPFKGKNVSMIILLPHYLNGIFELEKKFSPDFLDDQISQMYPSKVDIVLPKFKIEFEAIVTRNLKKLGAKSLFNPETANLSEMLRRDAVAVGDVIHKTVVSVTENGVEAAAATAIIVLKSFGHEVKMPNFLVDHPFLFVLYERRIKMILFVGRVMAL